MKPIILGDSDHTEDDIRIAPLPPKLPGWPELVDATIELAITTRHYAQELRERTPLKYPDGTDHIPKKRQHSRQIKVGTLVGYGYKFLKSIGMSHTYMSHAKGRVISLRKIGTDTELAQVLWHKSKDGTIPDLPTKINVKNLAPVGPNTDYCNCT